MGSGLEISSYVVLDQPMVRPLRIEYPGAIYHIPSQGNAREKIFLEDADRLLFWDVFGAVVGKYNWRCHAYCLMDNHYHVLIETPDPNLSPGMRQLNGVYTQSGPPFSRGDTNLYSFRNDENLLEICRYIVLNPVRAGMVNQPKEWGWSSCRETGYT
jgi:REP element-mobilizing transposase RayT